MNRAGGSPRPEPAPGQVRWLVVGVAAGLIISGLTLGPSGWAPGSSTCPHRFVPALSARSPIQHVFFLIKENHALENYFGNLSGVVGYPPNGSFRPTYGANATLHPFPLDASTTTDLPHGRSDSLADFDLGRNDNFVAQAASDGNSVPADAIGYYTAKQIPDYYAYAHRYTLGDQFFSGVMGPTLPNRFFDLGLTDTNWTTDLHPPPSAVSGPTLLNQLGDAGLPWDYFYSGPGGAFIPRLVPALANDSCLSNHLLPMDRFAATLSGSDPPSMAYIDPSPDPLYSEHPPQNVTLGEQWSVAVINTIFQSPIGSSSAVFLFFDENGGFWDPVAPSPAGPLGDGFRIPLLVLSAWTPADRISHQRLDPSALIRFVEDNWGLSHLTPQIDRAPALSGFFDFGAPPQPPLLLATPVQLGAGTGTGPPLPSSIGPPRPAYASVDPTTVPTFPCWSWSSTDSWRERAHERFRNRIARSPSGPRSLPRGEPWGADHLTLTVKGIHRAALGGGAPLGERDSDRVEFGSP